MTLNDFTVVKAFSGILQKLLISLDFQTEQIVEVIENGA